MPSAITRYYYSSPIRDFIHQDAPAIVGELVRQSAHDITINQRNAWQEEIDLLKDILKKYAGRGSVYFEYNIPRLGRRIDAIVLIDGVVFILEFKTDQGSFERATLLKYGIMRSTSRISTKEAIGAPLSPSSWRPMLHRPTCSTLFATKTRYSSHSCRTKAT